jgi:hypothetical protein
VESVVSFSGATVCTSVRVALAPLQERGLHHVNCGATLCGLGTLVQESILHGLQPVLQPPIVGPRSLHEGFEGVVLAPVQVKIGAQPGEAVVPCPSLTLQLLRAEVKDTEGSGIRK